MFGLLGHAIQLARNPAMTVWKAQAGAVNPDVGTFIEQNQADLADQAKTICDLTAYALMVVGAGTGRVAALKAGNSGDGDSIQRFRAGDAEALRTSITQWADADGNGVLQFKFDPGGDWHTFVVERIHQHGRRLGYRVFQSYQGTYRLSDFLGLTSPREFLRPILLDKHRSEFLGVDPDTRPDDAKKLERWEKVWQKIDAGVTKQVEAAQSAARMVGGGQVLNRENFTKFVVSPMVSSLETGIDQVASIQLTGHAVTGPKKCDSGVMVLRCDSIDPSQYEANYKSLGSGPATGWVQFE